MTTNETILAVVGDLMLGVRIQNLLEQAGYQPVFADDLDAATRAADQMRPPVAVVNIGNPKVAWEPIIRTLSPRMPILAFGSHKDLEARERALEAGATLVVANSKLVTDLPRLVGRLRQSS